jgi:hypothetical protein
MDPEHDDSDTNQSAPGYPRAMSVDAPDGPGYAQDPDAGELGSVLCLNIFHSTALDAALSW